MDEYNNEEMQEEILENEVLKDEDDNFETDYSQDLEEAANVEGVTPVDYEPELTVEGKKKFPIQLPIIIAAAVLLVAVLGFFCFKLLSPSSIIGSWVVNTDSTSDETSTTASTAKDQQVVYYTFADNNVATMKIGTMEIKGNWWYTDSNGATTDEATQKITISISYFLNGTFDFTTSGNALTGRSLTLKSSQGTSYNFDGKDCPDTSSMLSVSSKFKADTKLVGKWKNSQNNISYEFKSDGTCKINEMDTLYIDGTYTVSKGKVNITYMAQTKSNTSMTYKLSGDKATINSLEFVKE